ncbi:hypothetical protein EET67_18455 [Pseudaminobacter arsenicus]|uniref:Uncharacterized protein n=1 Tax=Borborobacter arsenicus TaxID=1851146 RepID=A0A432V2D0_9HYPH|nr:hypothetical protein EET67_18455 [Pseudaminobacter arsenicus]
MSGKEILSLDEFALASRKQHKEAVESPANVQVECTVSTGVVLEPVTPDVQEKAGKSSDAGKALRQMKRARMKGASHYVNVNLDRDTKQRLKLASFNMDTSMQAIMEKAIRRYLDANGH